MKRSEVPEMSPKRLHQHRRLRNTQCWWRHEEMKTLPHSWQELNQYNLSGNLGNVYFKSLKSAYTLILQVYRSFSSVQSLSHIRFFATLWTTAHQASLSITNSWSLLKLMSIESVMPSNHLILCHPLLLLPSIFPSIRVFSNESALHIRWPK